MEDRLGGFSLRGVHSTWAELLVLGVHDYYQNPDVPVLQLVPDPDHWTIDVPDLSRSYSPESEPAWRWLTESWPFPVPESSTTVTNLEALRGAFITEAARWEEDGWEMFAGAGPDVQPHEARIVQPRNSLQLRLR